jgi:hypothetical protein
MRFNIESVAADDSETESNSVHSLLVDAAFRGEHHKTHHRNFDPNTADVWHGGNLWIGLWGGLASPRKHDRPPCSQPAC